MIKKKLMRKIWKQITATAFAATLVISGLTPVAPTMLVQAETLEGQEVDLEELIAPVDDTTPEGGDDTTTPEGEADTTTPEGGDNTTTPEGGADTTTPEGGADTTTPEAGADTTAPEGGADTTTPEGGADTTTPEGGDDTTTPEGEDDVTTPEGGDDTTAPEGEDDVTTPEGEDDTTTPEGGDDTTTPEGETDKTVEDEADVDKDTEAEEDADLEEEELLEEEVLEESEELPVFFTTSTSTDSSNLFIDGDLGDDAGESNDSTTNNLWTNWTFTVDNDAIWGTGNAIKYDKWASTETTSDSDTTQGAGITFNADGTVTMKQVIASLEAGTYTVTGWTKDTKSKAGSIKGYHGSGTTTDKLLVNGITNTFQEFSYEFTLTEAQTDYVVGIQITSESGAWVCVDTMSLVKTADYTAPVEVANYFDDGDLGDDGDEDLWNDGIWTITASDNAIWGTDSVKYDIWASTETTAETDTTRGLGIYYNAKGSMTVTQKIEALEAGTYIVTGWTKDTKSKTGNIKGYHGEGITTDNLLTGGITSTFQEFTYEFTLTEAQTDYVVGVQVTTELGAWVCLDTLSLTKKAADADEKAKLAKLVELKELIDECKALEAEKADYTEASYADLEAAIIVAEEFYNMAVEELDSVTKEDIQTAIDDLQAALDALVPSTEASVFVNKIDLKENFIKGVDISSYVSEKDSGVTYYDFDGNALDDQGFFNLLADAGVNWVRIRVWNNPYDASGNGYGGGNNDIEKAKTMGRLATNAGLGVLIDFHYSDFWADPAKQKAPKAWSSMSIDEKESAVYDFTLSSLNALKSAGVNVSMVQVGNETNNGICGESTSNWANVARIFNAGSKAVRDFDGNVKVALHFTEPNTGIQASIAENLNANNIDYDVFATSYYPFWHGTLDNLNTVLSDIAETYGKQVMVAETSYAYTYEDGDGHENNVRASSASSLALDYNISMQGQADAVSSVIKTINDTTGGIGMFYWEPAWIPVQKYDPASSDAANVLASNKSKWEAYGSGWAASYSAEYDPEDAGRYYGGSSWDNQALFDHDGHPMDSLNVFKYVDSGTTAAVKPDVTKAASAEFEYGQEIILPETVVVVYNDGSTEDVAVTWDADQVAQITTYGQYTVDGVAAGLKAVCNVEVFPKNLLVNGGFESGIGEGNGWTISCAESEASMIKLDSKDIKRGSNALKFDAWSATITGATVSQTVTGLEPGTYACYMNVEGAGETGSYTISISAIGDTDAGSAVAELKGWMAWDKPQVDNIVVENGDSITVTISITTTKLETWGTIDEVYLYRVDDPTDDPTDNPTDDSTVDLTPSAPSEPDNSSSDSSSSSSSAAPVMKETVIEWSSVDSLVTSGAAKAVVDPATNNTNVNVTVNGPLKVAPSVLQNLKGTNTTVAFHVGNGIALSISGQNLAGLNLAAFKTLDLTVNTRAKNIPASVAATKSTMALDTKQFAVKDTGTYPMLINLHMAVGSQYVGKVANLYRHNAQTGRLEYCGSFVVTKEGQAMFALRQGGNYLVTVTHSTTGEAAPVTGGDYVVQLGDSLYIIAKRNNMSLEELIRKNPQISDTHMIRPGMVINF